MNEQTKPAVEMPVCPFCNTHMMPKYFTGYYESFAMWECECHEIPGAEEVSGAFA